MSKLHLILKGSTIRVVQTLISIVVGFLMMPFLIGTLGNEKYGLWVVVSSVAGTFYLLDIGFSSAVTRFSAKYIHEDRHSEANAIISTALAIYAFLGMIVLFVSILIAAFGVEIISSDVAVVDLVQILLILFGVQLALEFPAKALPGIINAFVRYDLIAYIRMGKNVVDAICIWIALSAGYGLVAMAVICLVTGVISTICYVVVVKSLYPNLNVSLASIEKPTFFRIFHFSKWVFVFDLSAMLRQKIDIWVVAYFLGPASLTVYYVAIRLTEYAVKFMLQATDMSTPLFIEYHASRNQKLLDQSLSIFFRVGLFLVAYGMIGFYVVGDQFIAVWMPVGFQVSEAWMLLLVLAASRFSVFLTTPFQSMLLTFNRHDLSALLAIFELALCAITCFYLTPVFGLMGAAISLAVPSVIFRLLVFPIIVRRFARIADAQETIRIIVFVLASCAIGLFLRPLLSQSGLVGMFGLLVGALIISICAVGISPILMSRSELEYLKLKFLGWAPAVYRK